MRALLISTALVVGLGACQRGPQPPGDTGVCYYLASAKGADAKFNVVAKNIPDMEHCAAQLEVMRVRFLSLGGSNQDIVGAYQGAFLFLGPTGVFTGDTLDGTRYPFMVRS